MEKTINIDIFSLYYEIENYLYDVGFTKDLYKMNYWVDRYYVEIIFLCEEAIDYLIEDVKKYKKKYEIKKYKKEKIISAIVTYK